MISAEFLNARSDGILAQSEKFHVFFLRSDVDLE
jgi:hypothetical protein